MFWRCQKGPIFLLFHPGGAVFHDVSFLLALEAVDSIRALGFAMAWLQTLETLDVFLIRLWFEWPHVPESIGGLDLLSRWAS